jgi:deoxyhypusine monooxygenase
MFAAAPPLEVLKETLKDTASPVSKSMRAAYFLRSLHTGSDCPSTKEAVISVLASALRNKSSGALLRHEFAYVLGQMRDKLACDALQETLDDTTDNVMVRHECGEALGAIGELSSLHCLRRNMTDGALEEVAQTCEVAVNFINWQLKGEDYEISPPRDRGHTRAIVAHKKRTPKPRCAICTGFEDATKIKMRAPSARVEALDRVISRLIASYKSCFCFEVTEMASDSDSDSA